MHILVTNDDGVQAPGLLALVQQLKGLGDLTVVAPNKNWSASGHVKTMHRPLRAYPTELADGSEAWTSDGAPSDCVALALLGLIESPIDLVVSGINPTANIGHDITYSGTVTAAIEGAIGDISSMAVSMDTPDDFEGIMDFHPAAKAAAKIASRVIQQPASQPLLLNVNIPHDVNPESARIEITRQGQRLYRDQLVQRTDPRGRPYYWIGGDPPTGVAESGTDYWALAQGYISITPLQLDFTNHDLMGDLEYLIGA